MTTLPDLAHEAHGGDETPKPADCPVCEAEVTYFLRWGEGRPEPHCGICGLVVGSYGTCCGDPPRRGEVAS